MLRPAPLVGCVALVLLLVSCSKREPPPPPPAAKADPQRELIARGEYLAAAGDCNACHTIRGGKSFAGGLPMPTPFGVLYTPNITPDKETGIGAWSADDFWGAMHEGRSKDGSFLYPAFPYTNYTKVTRADSDAIYAYIMSLPPVQQKSRPHEMGFPYNQRKLMAGWRALYFKPGEFKDDPNQSAEWNRGAYLVEGLGHCNACHATRNALGAITEDDDYSGGLIPVQNWYAPSLTSSRETGLGDWELPEIVELLRTGVSERSAVFGPMADVVKHSLQELSLADLKAMAAYLKAQSEKKASAPLLNSGPSDEQTAAMMKSGAKVYKDACASCHQPQGEGVPRVYPPLANNAAITMRNPVNPIRMVLNGGFPPSTEGNPRPYGMPPFYQELSDEQVAAVVTFIRGSWGNTAEPTTAAEVARSRGVPAD
ncbi:MAG TPA: cytochrome c [Burkholderiaceae bacterium]|nr:cytochrome c [Burkholderiaceae bacterium]